MSDKDKPADPDPDATVTFRGGLTKPPDDDATVMMPAKKALEKPADDDATVMMPAKKVLEKPADDDATVMMPTRDALKEPDPDSTVRMTPGALKEEPAAEAAAETAAAIASPAVPPAAFKTEADPDITATGIQTLAPPPPAPSRMPMIVGGVVVVLVGLYFAFSGGKAPEPVAPKADVAAPAAPAPAPAPIAAAPAPAPAAAPAAPASSAASAAPPPAAPAPAAAAPAAGAGKSSLKERLAGEIQRGLVAVSEQGGVTTVTIANEQQFASGGVDPEAKVRPVLGSIAAALDKVPGAIVVTGHADAKPSNNPKFPSNQELSAARAQSAARVMAAKLSDPKRIKSEGASDSQPVAPSDTVENRAKNRRVVIVLKPSP